MIASRVAEHGWTQGVERGRPQGSPHVGAPGSGAPRGNQNARQHGLFTREAIAERKQIRTLLGEARKLMQPSGYAGQESGRGEESAALVA
jgi:uncharacterized protein YjcR